MKRRTAMGKIVAGERLFGETIDQKSIRPLNARTVGDSLVYLTYEVIEQAA
jgi:hypothetical protein